MWRVMETEREGVGHRKITGGQKEERRKVDRRRGEVKGREGIGE